MKKLLLVLLVLISMFSCTSYHVIDVDSDLTYRIVPATLNLLQKEFPSKDYGTVVELDCAKGEGESCQIVFLQLDRNAAKKQVQYRLEQSPLISETGEILTETEIGVIDYVHVKKPSIAGFNEINYYPDPVLPQNTFTVEYKKSQSVLYNVYIPRDTKEGQYTCTLDLYENDVFAYSIPVTVNVYKTTLPVTPYLRTWFHDQTGHMKKYYDSEVTRDFKEDFYDYCLERFRINAEYQLDWTGVFYKDDNGKFQANWETIDKEIVRKIEDGVTAFAIPIRVGYDIFNPEKENFKKECEEKLSLINQHLVEKGWENYFLWYNFDEPKNNQIDLFKKFVDWGKEYAPNIKSFCTLGWSTPRKFRELTDSVDIWVPHIDQYETKFFPTRQKLGDEIWIYTCIQTFYTNYCDSWKIDTYGTCHRSLGWWLYKYDIDGYLYWSLTCWKKNPWEDIETYPFGNGDGCLVYPPFDRQSWPYFSIRLYTQRDGFEDYDLLKMLEEASKKEDIYTLEELEEIQDILSADSVIPRKSSYTKDDFVMVNLHKRILELLDKSLI